MFFGKMISRKTFSRYFAIIKKFMKNVERMFGFFFFKRCQRNFSYFGKYFIFLNIKTNTKNSLNIFQKVKQTEKVHFPEKNFKSQTNTRKSKKHFPGKYFSKNKQSLKISLLRISSQTLSITTPTSPAFRTVSLILISVFQNCQLQHYKYNVYLCPMLDIIRLLNFIDLHIKHIDLTLC